MENSYLLPHDMKARRGTIPSLDGLRAVSILLVLLAHFVNARLFAGGLGVYTFFVISGFLITRLMIVEHNATGTVSLPLFYARRVLRLYPVIVVFAALIIGIDILLNRPYNWLEPASALGYFANYLYVHLDYFGIPAQMPFGVFWSLSIEEHFYIFFPVIFLLLNGRVGHLMGWLIALCVGSLGLRLAVAWIHPEYLTTQIFYTYSQYRLDSIGFGVILALACETHRGRRSIQAMTHPAVALGAVVVTLSCLLMRDAWFRETLRYTLLGCAIDVLVAAVLFGKHYRSVQWILNTPLLVWIGRLSYSLYVWHEGVASFLQHRDLPVWQTALIGLSGSTVVATISYYALEQPCLRLRDRFRSRPRHPSFVTTPPMAHMALSTLDTLSPPALPASAIRARRSDAA